jgi:hypothetical protein
MGEARGAEPLTCFCGMVDMEHNNCSLPFSRMKCPGLLFFLFSPRTCIFIWKHFLQTRISFHSMWFMGHCIALHLITQIILSSPNVFRSLYINLYWGACCTVGLKTHFHNTERLLFHMYLVCKQVSLVMLKKYKITVNVFAYQYIL